MIAIELAFCWAPISASLGLIVGVLTSGFMSASMCRDAYRYRHVRKIAATRGGYPESSADSGVDAMMRGEIEL